MWDLIKGRCTYTTKTGGEALLVAFSPQEGKKYCTAIGNNVVVSDAQVWCGEWNAWISYSENACCQPIVWAETSLSVEVEESQVDDVCQLDENCIIHGYKVCVCSNAFGMKGCLLILSLGAWSESPSTTYRLARFSISNPGSDLCSSPLPW